MPKITVERDSISLVDDLAIEHVIRAFKIARIDSARDSTRPLWERYFYRHSWRHFWHHGEEIWLLADDTLGILKRTIIRGLEDEDAARRLRYDFHYYPRADDTDIERLAYEDPDAVRDRHSRREFQGYLRDVRSLFYWSNGVVVETEGRFGIPVSKLGLSQDDQELLRAVFARLPTNLMMEHEKPRLKIRDGNCSACGQPLQRHRQPIKQLKAAREKVARLSAHFADDGFEGWLEHRVVVGAINDWTRAADLYASYSTWITNWDGSRLERSEIKRTAMSLKRWGSLMGAKYDRRRDGKGHLYRVRLLMAPYPHNAGLCP